MREWSGGRGHRRWRWWAGIAVFALFVGWRSATAPARAIQTARIYGHLAPLPASATDVRAVEFHNLFSGEAFVRFRALPQEIETFLSASPGLRGVTPQKFTPAHQYLPYPKEM